MKNNLFIKNFCCIFVLIFLICCSSYKPWILEIKDNKEFYLMEGKETLQMMVYKVPLNQQQLDTIRNYYIRTYGKYKHKIKVRTIKK
jgi:hypothetical protein